MTSKHIKRDWTGHTEEVIRPTYEYIGVEIFCFDHELTSFYTPNSIKQGENYKLSTHRHLKCLVADDEDSSFVIKLPYNCKMKGEYRIDILYENKNSKDLVGAYSIEKGNSKIKYLNSKKIINVEKQIASLEKQIKTIQDRIKDLEKSINKVTKDKKSKLSNTDITKLTKANKANLKTLKKKLTTLQKKLADGEKTLETTHRIKGSDLKFDGEKDWLKRKTLFKEFNKGTNNVVVEIPNNCYFLGARITRVITLTGDSDDSLGTVLMLDDVEFTISNKTDPVEAKISLAYDNALENKYSESGYYIDFADEINIYVKETANYENNPIHRRFGGYISSFSIDNDLKTLSLNCSDRLQDGESKYMLATMLILQGTGSTDEEKYYNPISFNNYGAALKYICGAYETTLNSNIKSNYLVDGEKYNKGFALRYGNKKDIKKVATVNAKAKMQKNFVTLRNNSSGKKSQAMTLYNAKDHVKKYPVQLRKIKADGTVDEDKDMLTFHMTYGLGDPKTEKKSTTIDSSSGGTGGQKWTKCGVSQDKKYVMGIGQRGVGRNASKYPYGVYFKAIYENKCPYCHQATLKWDSCRSDSKCIRGGSKRNFPVPANETEFTCENCDCDFDVPTGYSKEGQYLYKLKKVGSVVKSSKSEQTKLHQGKMEAVAKGGVSVSSDDVLKEVANIAKKYKYQLGTTSSYSAMKKDGRGDCWAFSDLLFTELKKRKVNCKIYQYATEYASNHRSVQYQNAKGEYVSFPYKKYGLSRMLVQTSGWKSAGKPYKWYKAGGNINNVTSSSSSSSSTTTETYTYGYDRDKPIQGYFEIAFSTEKSLKAKQYKINLNFTLKAGTDNDWSGLPNYWVNNAQRQISVDMKGFFDDNYKGKNIYLQSIRFVTPKIKTKTNQDNTDWYTNNKTTHDNSSCKMDLYQIIFDNKPSLNPQDLQSTGKSLNSILEDIIKQADYTVRREYGKHRKDDKIFFGINNAVEAKFTATEGDDNNILEWTNVTYNPISNLKNKTICVFQRANNKYSYVDTGSLKSILKYGERTALKSISEQIGAKEAYFNAKNNEEYNPEQSFSYTVVVPYAPLLNIDDLVKVISNRHTLNDVKPVKSLKVSWKNDRKPTIQTEIGLDELEPYLRLKKEQEKIRKQAKAETTYFGRTADNYDGDDADDIYIWEN